MKILFPLPICKTKKHQFLFLSNNIDLVSADKNISIPNSLKQCVANGQYFNLLKRVENREDPKARAETIKMQKTLHEKNFYNKAEEQLKDKNSLFFKALQEDRCTGNFKSSLDHFQKNGEKINTTPDGDYGHSTRLAVAYLQFFCGGTEAVDGAFGRDTLGFLETCDAKEEVIDECKDELDLIIPTPPFIPSKIDNTRVAINDVDATIVKEEEENEKKSEKSESLEKSETLNAKNYMKRFYSIVKNHSDSQNINYDGFDRVGKDIHVSQIVDAAWDQKYMWGLSESEIIKNNPLSEQQLQNINQTLADLDDFYEQEKDIDIDNIGSFSNNNGPDLKKIRPIFDRFFNGERATKKSLPQNQPKEKNVPQAPENRESQNCLHMLSDKTLYSKTISSANAFENIKNRNIDFDGSGDYQQALNLYNNIIDKGFKNSFDWGLTPEDIINPGNTLTENGKQKVNNTINALFKYIKDNGEDISNLGIPSIGMFIDHDGRNIYPLIEKFLSGNQ